MTERRSLSNDLTDQGKYQLAHGSTRHTPGPWSAFAGAVFTGPKDSPTFVARMVKDDDGIAEWDERHANQQLIAAAPDLVLALQVMLCQFQDHEQYGEDDADAVSIARAAIAKATGGDA